MSRSSIVSQKRFNLVRFGNPRLQMTLILMMTGLTGFVTSMALLHAGVAHMGFRYAASMVVAYLFLFFFLYLWMKTKVEDYLPDVVNILPDGSVATETTANTAAGEFASSSFVESGAYMTSDSVGGSEAASFVGDIALADEASIPVLGAALLLLIATSLLVVTGWMVYIAPNLMADILVDSLVAAGLYKSISHYDRRHWMESVIKHTWVPFLGMLIIVSVFGTAIEHYVPAADNLSQAVHMISKK